MNRIILCVGATGSIGREVVAYALEQGHAVKALVRNVQNAHLPSGAELIEGDLTQLSTFESIAQNPNHADIDAIVFTQGTHGDAQGMRLVDYGAVRNALLAFTGRSVRVALMTTIGVTVNDSTYQMLNEGHNWKRRGERLLRASGQEYAIVRPGWFDYNDSDEREIVFLQGDRRRYSSPKDGVIARSSIAKVLVDALQPNVHSGVTLELVARHGQEQHDLTDLFNHLDVDHPSELDDWDAVADLHNLPYKEEPKQIIEDLRAVQQ